MSQPTTISDIHYRIVCAKGLVEAIDAAEQSGQGFDLTAVLTILLDDLRRTANMAEELARAEVLASEPLASDLAALDAVQAPKRKRGVK